MQKHSYSRRAYRRAIAGNSQLVLCFLWMLVATSFAACDGASLEPNIRRVESSIELSVWSTLESPADGDLGAGTATPLVDGRVLFVKGGAAHVYDDATRAFTPTGPLSRARTQHTATLLQSGAVLVVGGQGAFGTTELYDPATNTWSAGPSLSEERFQHGAALRADGRVLVAGGYGPKILCPGPRAGGQSERIVPSGTAELFDPTTNRWSVVAAPSGQAGASLLLTLRDGTLLMVTQGESVTCEWRPSLRSASLYDPANESWVTLAAPLHPNLGLVRGVSLPNGDALFMGAQGGEIYGAATHTWTAVSYVGFPFVTRLLSMALLTDGRVLVLSAVAEGLQAQLFDPRSNRLTNLPPPSGAHSELAPLPHGRAILGFGPLAPAERFEIALPTLPVACADAAGCAGAPCVDGFCCDRACSGDDCSACSTARGAVADGICTELKEGYSCESGICGAGTCVVQRPWAPTLPMSNPRFSPTAVPLHDGRVLVLGGHPLTPEDVPELYDPKTNSWSKTAPAHSPHPYSASVVLADGRVMVVDVVSEIYDPASDSWTRVAAPLTTQLSFPAATLLSDGRVFILADAPNTAQIFDPGRGEWTLTADTAEPRTEPFVALLSTGKVLVLGRVIEGTVDQVGADLFDPDTGMWTRASTLRGRGLPRHSAIAVDGQVLWISALGVRLYVPSRNRWRREPSPPVARIQPAFALLTDGRVAVTGGQDPAILPQDAWGSGDALIFSPQRHRWSRLPPMLLERASHALAPLPGGGMIAVGGGPTQFTVSGREITAEVYLPSRR
jgi:hypothetical protein